MRHSTETHGHSKGKRSPTYNTWRAMLGRCYDPKNNRYSEYGARGITVCDRWRKFENFLADMGERPAGMTLDRERVNGMYSKSNCRWADRFVQRNNRLPAKNQLVYQGKGTKEWAVIWNMTQSGAQQRLRKLLAQRGVPPSGARTGTISC